MDPKDALAAERTLLAWIRTGIALMGLGFVVARFGLFLRELAVAGGAPAPARIGSSELGVVVVVAGVAVNLWASLRHRQMLRRMRAGLTEVGSVGPMVVGIATGIGGAALVAVLLASVMR
jgi:putative membrane protein